MPVMSTCAKVIAGSIGLVLALATPERALAEYPERPLTMIVPFAAGGAIDIVARVLSEPLSKAMRQPIVVENRPGAGGNIGVAYVSRAKPDGYTILMGSSSFAINPSLYAKVSYEPLNDFAPVADLGYYPCVIVGRTDLGIDTLADLIALAKSRPGKLSYATPGAGTVPHLAAELLKLRAGIDMLHIPYPGGGQAVQALLSGTVEVASLATPQALPQIQSGRVKALALTGRERWPELPDLPTLQESGLKRAVAETWQGFFMPAGTPPAIIQKVAFETTTILQNPAVIEKFRQVGLVVTGQGPDALKARLVEEIPQWREVVESAGMKID
jgi:tripartite-type tricarboxylate transporter receptor subunit TctC